MDTPVETSQFVALTPLLADITAKLGQAKDTVSLYDTVVQICLERFNAEAASLYLEESDGNTINMVAGKGYSGNIVGEARYSKGEGVTGHVWQLGEPFQADSNDQLTSHSWHRGKMDERQWTQDKACWSLIVVPLRIGHRVLGVLKVENKMPEPTAFSKEEFELLQTVANVMSLAVENARLAERSHTIVLTALQKAVADLAGVGSFFPTTLYGQVVATCREILDAEAASLYLESEDSKELTMVAGDGYSKILVNKATYSPGEGITGNVWSDGVPVKIDNVQELRTHAQHAGKHDDTQWTDQQHCWSLLAVPLKIAGHQIGVLKVENKIPEPSYFTIGEQRLLEMIASIFALSVRNERSVRRLQEAGLFAYDYAHKSKGDLAVLSSCVERLSQGLPKGMLAGSEKSLSLMEDVVSNLKRSAEDILIIAKESKVRLDPISLATVSRLIDERWGWHLRQRQITVENHIVDNNGLLVVDRAMLISIFDNLIQNSIEAIAAKQEETAQYKGTLGVFCSLSDDTVEIYICDDALGISPDIRDKLFKDRVTTKRTGTGLGLTIVRRYIEANRGKVSLCTKLPESAAVSGADDRWRVILKLSFPRGQSDRLYSVLVVDDQKTFYQNLTIDFQSRPAFGNIDYAESLAKALASLKSKKYDALILDMWFGAPPGGAEAYSMLRKSGFSGLVMVVSSFQEKIDEARRLQGVADVLSKDLQRSIPERLENLLRER